MFQLPYIYRVYKISQFHGYFRMRPSLYAQNINTSRIYKLLVEVVVFDNVNKAYVDMCTGQLWIQNQSCFKIWNSILPSESYKKRNKKETKDHASCGIFFPVVFKLERSIPEQAIYFLFSRPCFMNYKGWSFRHSIYVYSAHSDKCLTTFSIHVYR